MKKIVGLLVFLSSIATAIGVTHYVDLNSPSPTSPYTSWATAATSIQDAVVASSNGDTVVLTNGNFVLSTEVLIDKSISVESVNGPQVTVIDGNGVSRCINVSVDGVTLSGLTITGGYSTYAGGVWGRATTITNCVITENVSQNGAGGVWYCKLYNCIISNNSSGGNGGGCSNSDTYNCLISGNIVDDLATSSNGGGVRNGKHVNSTIVGNHCDGNGGGAYSQAELINCIVYYNTADLEGNDLYLWSVDDPIYTCSPSLTNGVNGNISVDPLFRDISNDDYRLMPNSPCRDAGDNSYVETATDLEGNQRIVKSIVDMGTYEYQALGLRIILEESFDLQQTWTNAGKQVIWDVPLVSSNHFYRTRIEIIE